MKNYSSSKSQKGKTSYRTPSRWKATRPELTKRLKYDQIKPWKIKIPNS
ncbi:MAG: hypothetical protein AAB390_02585 [Patescibacteria group bacterium]